MDIFRGGRNNPNKVRRGVPAQRKEKRREEAKVRQEEYDKLTPLLKLAKLDREDFVAAKQVARLKKLCSGE